MNLLQIGRILWKRRLWVAGPGLLVASGVAAAVMLAPPWYQASAKLLLESRDRTLAAIGTQAAEASQLTSLTRTGSPLETQMEVFKSAPIVTRVIAKLQLTHPSKGRLLEPEEFLGRGEVTVMKATDILDVSYMAGDPADAQRITNAWVDEFLADNRAAQHRETRQATTTLETGLAETKRLLDAAEFALKAYKEANGTMNVAEVSRAYTQDLFGLEVEQRRTEGSLGEARARAHELQAKIGLSPEQAIAETVLAQSPGMQRLRQQLLDAESNPVLTRTKLTPKHPEVVQARAQIEALRRRAKEKATELLGRQLANVSSGGELDQTRQAMTRDLIKAEVDALGYQTRLTALEKLKSRAHQRLGTMPGQAFELTKLERNAVLAADRYRLLHKRLDEARIADASASGNVRVIAMATLPTEPSNRRKAPLLVLGLLAGLLLGPCLALLRDQLDGTLGTVEDAEPLLGLSLGLIPWIKDPAEAANITSRRPRSAEAQAYRNLAYNMTLLPALAGPRAFVFGSAGAGEGKSTTVANLAVSLAQTGKRVLVVDADMHRPTLHHRYGMAEGPGFAQVLEGTCTLAEVRLAGPEPTLDVVIAGPLPANPAALLDSTAFEHFLAMARDTYDVVLFDAPPVLAVPDARIIAGRVDGLILVARLGKVSPRACEHVLALMKASKLTVLGSVLLGLKPEDDGYYAAYMQPYEAAGLKK